MRRNLLFSSFIKLYGVIIHGADVIFKTMSDFLNRSDDTAAANAGITAPTDNDSDSGDDF